MSRVPARRARRTTRRATRLALALTVVGALVLAATVVWRAAYADFSVSISAGTVPVSTATLSLADDDAGTALFAATDLRPGAAATRCIVVTSTSTAPTVVRVYTGNRPTGSLSGALRITVDAGTGGCAGFVSVGSPATSTLSAFPTTYADGVASWKTTGASGETRTYQVTYTLPTNATTAGQGGTASLPLTWEAQT
jgi:hypothetical protein